MDAAARLRLFYGRSSEARRVRTVATDTITAPLGYQRRIPMPTGRTTPFQYVCVWDGFAPGG